MAVPPLLTPCLPQLALMDAIDPIATMDVATSMMADGEDPTGGPAIMTDQRGFTSPKAMTTVDVGSFEL